MEILLKQTVDKLGYMGDIVNVKAGYARNYLLPKGVGLAITQANKNEIERQKKHIAVKKAEEIKEKQAVADLINPLELTVIRKVSEGNNLYGSVSEADIVGLLAENNVTIEKRNVKLSEHIKSVGDHTVLVHLAPGVEASFKLKVEAEEVEETEEESETESEESDE